MSETENARFKTLNRLTGFRLIKTPIGCWVKERARLNHYSNINFCGANLSLHIISAILFHNHDVNEIKAKRVCHNCNIKACCNPSHIYVGTPSTNIKDIFIRQRNYIPDGQLINRNDYIEPHNPEFNLEFLPSKDGSNCH